MWDFKSITEFKNVAFIPTRIAGTDGVPLEIEKWAGLVTYPSTFERFGNAFLEAIYFRNPIVVNAYSIYTKDIKPKGFSVIEIDGFVTSQAVEKARQVLDNPDLCHAMVDHNYELGKKFFSYAVLRQSLRNFMRECGWVPGEFL